MSRLRQMFISVRDCGEKCKKSVSAFSDFHIIDVGSR